MDESEIPPPAPAETIRAEQYNMRNPSVKRILAEAKELCATGGNDEFSAQPLEENIFEWHFTFRGAPDTDFDVGVYHGRIILPPDYPMNPPAFIMLTPNGRFEIGKKICLSISSYHPETWRPCWSIRTAVAALVAFMNTSSPGAIGSLDCSSEQRKAFARKSLTYECPQCGNCAGLLKYARKDEAEAETAEQTEAPAQAQRVFRIPHNDEELDDHVILPEHIPIQVVQQIVPEPEDHGDSPFIPPPVNLVDPNLRVNHMENSYHPNSFTFNMSVGLIVFTIAGIIIRRIWMGDFDSLLGFRD